MSLSGHSHDATCKGTGNRDDRENRVSYSSPGMEDSPEECVVLAGWRGKKGVLGEGKSHKPKLWCLWYCEESSQTPGTGLPWMLGPLLLGGQARWR